MPERERRHGQPGNNFVAYAQKKRAIKHIVRKPDRRRHGDHFPAEQGKFHPILALEQATPGSFETLEVQRLDRSTLRKIRPGDAVTVDKYTVRVTAEA